MLNFYLNKILLWNLNLSVTHLKLLVSTIATSAFWSVMEWFTISLSLIVPLLIVIAFFTLLERKVMASLQRRVGPNMHGYYGVMQPIIDGLKLLWKEIMVPAKANFYIFSFSPLFMMSLSFSLWAILPLSFAFTIFDSKLSLVTFFVISSINVYNIILAGWSSNSKYAFLGAIRAMAQMFSYELISGFMLIFMMMTVGSLRIYDIMFKQYYVGYLIWPLLPFAAIFFIVLLMETNRAPFDLPEAESELVAGYNVEYSSIMFAMFFLGEYCNILAMTGIWTSVFWGGVVAKYFGTTIFILKVLFLCTIFIFIRAMLPRYRLDQMIYVGWHVLLPITLGIFFFLTCLCTLLNIFPGNSTFFNLSTMPSRQRLEIIDFHPVATAASFDALARRQYMLTCLIEDEDHTFADLEALAMQTRKTYVSSWIQLFATAIGTTDNSVRTAILTFLESEIPSLKLKYELFLGMNAVITGHWGPGTLEVFSSDRKLYNHSVDALYSVFPTDPATISRLINHSRISLPDHFHERPFLISFSGYIKHQEMFLDMFAGLLPAEYRLKLDKYEMNEFNAFCDTLALNLDINGYKNRVLHKKNWPWSWPL